MKREQVTKLCTLQKPNNKLWKTGMTSIGSNSALPFLSNSDVPILALYYPVSRATVHDVKQPPKSQVIRSLGKSVKSNLS